MRATRHPFSGGTLFEIRTIGQGAASHAARIYVVQETSLVLQRLALDGGDAFVGATEEAARDEALAFLKRQFGRETGKSAPVPIDAGFRTIDERRTA